jgi:phosphohistidine phosphatase
VKKRITLLRHAKSSWKDEAMTDYERPLNKRGERDASMMGKRFVSRGARPSLIMTSTAKRARRTAKLIAREIGYPIEFIHGEKELYLASPEQILKVIAEQDNTFNNIILVGHNPGITELVNRLSDAHIDNIPTCGVATLEAELKDWSKLDGARCHLDNFDYPRNRGESESEEMSDTKQEQYDEPG